MNPAEKLDAALLGVINSRWAKVAMVLGEAARTPGLGLDKEHEYDILAKRLGELVAAGQVCVEGDLRKWRLSEVRLAKPKDLT